MKRVICLITAIITCLALACPVFAAEGEFVPSISYKGAPEIVPVKDGQGADALGALLDEDGKIVDYIYEDCLVVTPVSEAKTSTLIPDAAEELLLKVYDELTAGTMQIPYEKHNADLKASEMVIRDLFDASWLCADHPEAVTPKGVTVQLTFDLGVGKNDAVYCMSYKNNAWDPIVSVTNNGDGTVTCVFEDFCPVEFSVRQNVPSVDTGDRVGKTLYLWVGIMVVSAAAVVVLLVAGRRKNSR